jgi:polysaccharide pyruvyl transferase WcaK-like protein
LPEINLNTIIMKVGILYDAYVLGADTVWTPIRVHDTEAYMFYYEFCKDQPARKISWAASIGSDSKEDLDMMIPILKERLKNFDYISVRERETVDYVQQLTDKKVFHAIDPVLMLDKEVRHLGQETIYRVFAYQYKYPVTKPA